MFSISLPLTLFLSCSLSLCLIIQYLSLGFYFNCVQIGQEGNKMFDIMIKVYFTSSCLLFSLSRMRQKYVYTIQPIKCRNKLFYNLWNGFGSGLPTGPVLIMQHISCQISFAFSSLMLDYWSEKSLLRVMLWNEWINFGLQQAATIANQPFKTN
jgi:hypothetical protein